MTFLLGSVHCKKVLLFKFLNIVVILASTCQHLVSFHLILHVFRIASGLFGFLECGTELIKLFRRDPLSVY